MPSTSNVLRATASLPLPDALSVFPMGQNASSTVISQLVVTVTLSTTHINAELQSGLRNTENQFNPTPICRPRQNEELSQLSNQNQAFRAALKAAHQKMYIELCEAIFLLNKTRRALVNAKRVRNTQTNQMLAILRHLRNVPTRREAILCLLNGENVSDKFKPRASPEQIRMLEQMIDQVKQNYRNASILLTQQIRWNYDIILGLLTQFQEHSDSSLAKIKQHVAECRKREQQLISCALHEFSFEHAWRSIGDYTMKVQVVQFGDHSHWRFIENAETGALIHNGSIDDFTPETHCNPEIIAAFHAAQAEAAASFADIQANSWVAPEFFDDGEYTTPVADFVEVWETDLPYAEAAEAGDQTPKATLKTNCSSSHKRDSSSSSRNAFATSSSNPKSKKSKKSKKFEPLRINENTNRTTGTLRDDECISKKDYDSQRKHICFESNKIDRNSGAVGGHYTKNDVERWTKKKAAMKMMSRVMSAAE